MLDGVLIHVLTKELQEKLRGSRIQKIYQPSKNDLLLILKGKQIQLLLSTHASHASVYMTTAKFEQPTEPPQFCMLLRKYLMNSLLINISQVGLERIIHLDFKTRDEIGDQKQLKLVVELMGKHSNIILLDPASNKIYDSIKRIPHSINKYRQLLPGQTYISPPDQRKFNPMCVNQAKFNKLFSPDKTYEASDLTSKFLGMGSLLAQEILYNAQTTNNLWEAFNYQINKAREMQIEPSIMIKNNKKIFYAWNLKNQILKSESIHYTDMSSCLQAFYEQKHQYDLVKQKVSNIAQRLNSELAKNKSKIIKLKKELEEVEEADSYRIFGELIMANLHVISPHIEQVELVNYYDPCQQKIEIKLSPKYTPTQNAERYFKKYKKIIARLHWNNEQIKKTEEINNYLESVLTHLETCSLADIDQIKEELILEGWFKEKASNNKKKKKKASEPAKFYATDGTLILVGKNNLQNELITHKLASKSDTWLHTKEIPGSHVVIKSKEVSERTLYEAALLAAYHSKARDSAQVPVDYTLIKYVKKPSGARPGFVIYDNHQTLYVTPDAKLVESFRKQIS